MNDVARLALATLVLALVTHVLVRPERYLRGRARDAFADLVAICARDRALAERLVEAELERGAPSREHAVRVALTRLLRDRGR